MNNEKKTMPVLPVEAYTSQAWFEKEQAVIFGNSWQFLGLVEDIKDAGDYVSVQCGHQNIVVVKGRDQRLRAFHNLCRHRGTQLLRAVGKKQKALTCPYHDWTYDLEGQLMSVPNKEREFPDLELDKICLHKASVDVWRGMIFVHPKPDAESITKWFAGTEEYLGPHKVESLIEYERPTYDEVINANWKIVAENYMDVYHLAQLHSATLNMYDHANAEYGWVGDHYMFWEPLVKEYFDNLDDMTPFKRIKGMTDEVVGAFVPWMFPNLGLVETENSWGVFHVTPIAPDKTRITIRTKFEEMTDWEYMKQGTKSFLSWGSLGIGTKYGDSKEGDPMGTGDVLEEDKYVCEQQQKSLSNPLFSIENTSQYGESTVRTFQSIVEKWMKEAK